MDKLMTFKTNHFKISESVSTFVATVVSQLQMNKPLVLADLVGLEEELVAHVARELPHALLLVLATFDVDCESRAHLVPSKKCLRLKKFINYKIFILKINQPKNLSNLLTLCHRPRRQMVFHQYGISCDRSVVTSCQNACHIEYSRNR